MPIAPLTFPLEAESLKTYVLLNGLPAKNGRDVVRKEVASGLRKIKVGIYDHAFHFAGGGQRYVATLAELLQHDYDITFIANKDIKLEQYKEWFDLDLSQCKLKIIKIPFFEQARQYHINEGMVIGEHLNPFDHPFMIRATGMAHP